MEKPLSINRRKNDRVDRSRDQTFSRRENDRRLYLYALYVTFSSERFDVNNPTRPLLRYRFSAVNRVDGKGSALLITLPRQCRKTCRCSFLPFNPAPAFPTNTNRVERIKHVHRSPLFVDRSIHFACDEKFASTPDYLPRFFFF